MKEVTGNLLNAEEVAIGHGVNTKGLMGAGVAKHIREAYPQISGAYIQWCNTTAKGGEVQLYVVSPERIIVNMASQELPGADARYEWLAQATSRAMTALMGRHIYRLALPRIGCGIGGLDWEAVKVILQLVEAQDSDFEIVIYTPEGQ